MLSTRHPRRSWAYDDRHQNDRPSMFRRLATHWRPVTPELRAAEEQRRNQGEQRKTLPPCWSPWLLIKD
jgi:hypothetical protein